MVFLTMAQEIIRKGQDSSHHPPGTLWYQKKKGRAMSDPASFFSLA
jgi:hypothetical protein